MLSTEYTEISFLQQLEERLDFGDVLEFLSCTIPQEAILPITDTLVAAILPPQKCVATVKCIPARRMRKAMDMAKNFFI